MTGTSTLLTDGSGAADFLGQGSCRFALVESRSERGFVQRAEAIGLRYNVAKRIEGYNISQGQGDLDRDLPLRRHGVRCPRPPASANPELFFALRRRWRGCRWRSWCARRRIRGAPRRRGGRRVTSLWLTAVLGVAIIVLMYALDAWEIGLMPTRGTPGLWSVRILTDFGKDDICAVGAGRAADRRCDRFAGVARNSALAVARSRHASAVSVLRRAGAGAGRRSHQMDASAAAGRLSAARPMPSTSRTSPEPRPIPAFRPAMRSRPSRWPSPCRRVWPRARLAMIVYALVIAASRLVLLAHHPSDVVAGALVGVIGAMFVRYWFAARRLGFAIHRDGTIVPLVGPSSGRLKRVARRRFGPIRSGRRKRRTPAVPAAGQLNRRVSDLPLPTQPRSPFPSLCPCATRPTTSRR